MLQFPPGTCSSLFCFWYLKDRSSVSGGYHGSISCKISCCYLWLTRLPFCFSCLHFFIGNLNLQFQFRNVDADDIALFNKCDRSATAASGDTCPMDAPLDAPLKRPSVIRATEDPSPIPAIADVGFSISLIPGPPFGPS